MSPGHTPQPVFRSLLLVPRHKRMEACASLFARSFPVPFDRETQGGEVQRMPQWYRGSFEDRPLPWHGVFDLRIVPPRPSREEIHPPLRRVPFHRGLEDNQGGNLRPPADGVPAQWKTRGCQMPGVSCPCSPYNECQRRTRFSHFKVSPLRGLPQGRPRRTVCRAPGRRKMRSVSCRQGLQEHPLYGREPSSEQLSLNRCARCDKLHRMPQARRHPGQEHKTISLGKDSHVQHLPSGPAQGAIRKREQEMRDMSRHRIMAFTAL